MATNDLALRLRSIFVEKELTLATAESCTGGLLGGAITAVSGSSAYYLGGVVSYAYSAKIALLGVQPNAIVEEGAVSAVVAEQMAFGALDRFGANVALSITGIAGPGGGTAEKPVGLTWIGLADAYEVYAERYLWHGDREYNRAQSVDAALRMLIAWGEAV